MKGRDGNKREECVEKVERVHEQLINEEHQRSLDRVGAVNGEVRRRSKEVLEAVK